MPDGNLVPRRVYKGVVIEWNRLNQHLNLFIRTKPTKTNPTCERSLPVLVRNISSLPPDNMTQVQGFNVENQGGSSATLIDPNSAQTIIGATVTSKLFTMKGLYKLRGLPTTGG